MLLLTAFVILLNLGLGVALGVYLGYGPPTLWSVWEVASGRVSPISTSTTGTLDHASPGDGSWEGGDAEFPSGTNDVTASSTAAATDSGAA